MREGSSRKSSTRISGFKPLLKVAMSDVCHSFLHGEAFLGAVRFASPSSRAYAWVTLSSQVSTDSLLPRLGLAIVRARRTMRLSGLNKLVNALIQSFQERATRISTSPSSALSSASSFSVLHSRVSHCSCCILFTASPLTKSAMYLTV